MTKFLAKSKLVLLFLIIGFISRIAFSIPVFFDPSRAFACTDARSYRSIALNLLSGKGFSMSDASPYTPETTVTPGYPIFLAGIYAVFDNSTIAVVLFQIVINVILILIVFLFVKKRFGDTAALISGAILTLDFNTALFTTQLTTETLFTFLFISSILFLVEFVEQGRLRYALFSGILIGLATLVRPITLFLGVPLLLFIILSKLSWRKIAGWAIVIAVQLACITPWIIRNKIVFDEYFYSTVSDMNLMRYHAVPLKASLENKPLDLASKELVESALGGKTCRNDAEYFRLTGAGARRYILKHPLPYTGMALLGGLGTLFSPLMMHEAGVFFAGQREPPSGSIMLELISLFSKGHFGDVFSLLWKNRLGYYGIAAFVVFVLYGLFHFAKLGFVLKAYILKGLKDASMLLSLTTGVYMLAFLGLAVVPRLRVPLEPLLALLAAIGIVSKKREKNKEAKHERKNK